jgi:hypothetical protein
MNYLKTQTILMLFISSLLITSCSLDDDNISTIDQNLDSKTYELFERSNSGVSGTATFTDQLDGSVLVVLDVTGTPQDGMHPSHIHVNTAAEGGGIAVALNDVNGATGISQTFVTETGEGSPVTFEDLTYDDLLVFDGYINIHLSANDLGTVVAQGDIGQNELTGESKSYVLGEKDAPGISGNVLFEERVNGEAQATIMLSGTPDGGTHPAHIHMNTAVEGGGILYTFTPVNGTTGMSRSNLATLDDDTAFGYADVLTVDGYVNVHLSMDNLGTIVAQGDIGVNELTGESITYTLDELNTSGVSGTIAFEERVNGEALATIDLTGTPDGAMHPAHIHANSAAETGPILYTFTQVDGTTGMSQSNISMLDDDTMFGYADILTVDGYVNVHLSADDLTVVAQTNIGENAM